MKLKQRDIDNLLETSIFGLTVAEILHRRSFEGKTIYAAESWLARMRSAKLLNSAPLADKTVYYHLTDRGVKALREAGHPISRSAARPLKPLTKATRLAALYYCSPLAGPFLRLTRPSHDPKSHPDIASYIAGGKTDPLRQKFFFNDGPTLGYLVLYAGNDRFVESKLKPKIISLAGWDSMWSRMEQQTFRLTVVTATKSHHNQLLAELTNDPPEFPWEIVLIKEVAAVLPRRRRSPFASDNAKQRKLHFNSSKGDSA